MIVNANNWYDPDRLPFPAGAVVFEALAIDLRGSGGSREVWLDAFGGPTRLPSQQSVPVLSWQPPTRIVRTGEHAPVGDTDGPPAGPAPPERAGRPDEGLSPARSPATPR